ncbi:MAG: uroporphyrinogen-III synthase [Armatimonadota bacterium]|nr:uroporphyrinogen-III synthase [Armatimonadota bacterium]MDR7427344.1 uroporphyrinogen-III synthase [Armatimonadota bacterium]MDR7464703.1 uroporphyrinogen-III synthase [Armatimonadota bacterium]MDR7468690.1 uroporphyrinogen-III synthase [Armatimonadota bacterium]MDR7474369.1 uroporphyrinogen-III synthase [Armatimonadota bacterium]
MSGRGNGSGTGGRRVLVTRPEGRELCARLQALGWDPRWVPTVALVEVEAGGPLDVALRRLDTYDWVVVTSAGGVRAVFQRLHSLGLPVPAAPRWAAVGPATAAALQAQGVTAAFVPDRYLTAAVARGLGEVAGRRILLPRADAASAELPRLLRERGAHVDQVVAYRTVEGPEESRRPLRGLLAEGIDVVLFTSGSTVRGFARLVDDPAAALAGVLVACIGPVTARAVRELGLHPHLVAEEHTTEGLIAALQRREARAAAHRPT